MPTSIRRAVVALAASVAAAAGTVPAVAQAAPTPAAGTAGKGYCLDYSSSEVQRALRVVGPPPVGAPASWAPRMRSPERTPNCPPLLWAVFETQGGTGASPSVVLLFRPGKFLRATTKPLAFQQVTATSPISVAVTYRWLRGDDANAAPSGGPVTSFFVGPLGDQIFRFGGLPPGVRG